MIDELHGLDPDEMSDGEVAALLVAVTQVTEAAEAAQLRTMGTFEARQVHKADGAWSAAAWIRERSHLTRSESNSLQRHARIIRTRPLLSHALDTMGAAKVRTVLRYTTFRTMEAFAEAEATILEQIGPLDVDRTATIMRWWARRVDQDGRKPRSWEQNEIDLQKTYQGDWGLGGGLDALTGAELDAALDAEAEVIFRAGGTGGVRLPARQMRAMALMELIRRSLNPGLVDTQVPPTVMVSVGLDDLLKATGRADLIGCDEHIDAETARRIACDAGITRIITGPRGEILDLGRTTRTAPARFKKALAVRDWALRVPRLRHDPEPLPRPPHPVVGPRPRAHRVENLALLCHFHHHLVHEGGWAMARAPDGTLEFRRPDGSQLVI